ncbi:MAG: hypothetical protein NC221_07825 [Duncaniella sp.]|nr:hypothetical protein [Muribaculum sp.]MCM1256012.1 hypothetical protein [Duncaniella sp.]
MNLFTFLKKNTELAKLPFTTDVHAHVLPGVDDGAVDIEESLSLLREMSGWGIRKVFATPHVAEGFPNDAETLDAALFSLREGIERAAIEIDLHRSSENRVDDFFISQIQDEKIKSFPGNYLLVENSYLQEPWQLDQFLFDLKLKGFIPVMAHPERFSYYHGSTERYNQLHQAGNLFQINLLSLTGAYGKEAKQAAELLIQRGYVDFLGTDIHHYHHVEIITSYLHTRQAHTLLPPLTHRLLNDKI